MKTLLLIAATLGILPFTGCTRNEPGTFGQGNAGVPGTVATGAPAEAEKGTNRIPSDADATAYESSSSTFEDRSTTNAPGPLTNPASQ